MNADTRHHRSLAVGVARPGVRSLRPSGGFSFGAFTTPAHAHPQMNAWTTKAAYPVICTDRLLPRPLERSP